MTFVAGQTLTAAQLNDLDIDSLVVDTDVLVVDKTNNRVGIGTSSPAEELHVLKDQDGDLTQMLVENLDQRVRIGSYYEAGVAQYAKIQSENDAGSDLALVLNPEGGNVGIGTTTPAEVLEISDPSRGFVIIDDTGGTVGASTFAKLEYRAGGSYAGHVGFNNTSSGVMGLFNNDGQLQIATNSADSILFRTDSTTRMTISSTGAVSIVGSLSKGSGSFRIPHPLPAMAETHNLVHSFVEAPQADNLYRGRVALVDGAVTVDLDEAAGMTTGTFELLNRDLQCFVVNNEGWTAVRGSVSGSTLTIEAQDATCADTVDWLVIGERHDQHMYDTEWTDDDGRVIVEPLRPAEPEPGPEPIQDVETEVTATEAP